MSTDPAPWAERRKWASGSGVDKNLGPPAVPASPCPSCWRLGVITRTETNTRGHTRITFQCADCDELWTRTKSEGLDHAAWRRRIDHTRHGGE